MIPLTRDVSAALALAAVALAAPHAAAQTYQGFPVSPLGSATVQVSGTKLTVSNLGSSGLDGVRISLPAGTGCWSAGLEPLQTGGIAFGASRVIRTYQSGSAAPATVDTETWMPDALFDYQLDFSLTGSTAGTSVHGFAGCQTQGSLNAPGPQVTLEDMPASRARAGYTTSHTSPCRPTLYNTVGGGIGGASLSVGGATLGGVDSWMATHAAADPPGGSLTQVEITASGFGSFTLTSLAAMPSGGGLAPGPVITEVCDGTLTGGQPKWVELTNIGDATVDLSAYSLGNFNNGGTTLGGGSATQLNPVLLAPGDSFVFAYESSANTACDPAGVLTCFETAYGFPADQYGGPFINGDDVIALFLGQATGDGSDAVLVDSYGRVGEDGTGTDWEYIDSYAYRDFFMPSGSFQAHEWFVAGPDALEDPGGNNLALIQSLTTPGVNVSCGPPTETYCTAKTNSCGTLPVVEGAGVASASAENGFLVMADHARGQKFGLMIYTNAGPASPPQPFQGGLLCIASPPLRRGPAVNSNGTAGQCDGMLSLDVNAFAAGLAGGNPAAFLSMPGTRIDAQWWARDTIANGSLLSDAIGWTVGP